MKFYDCWPQWKALFNTTWKNPLLPLPSGKNPTEVQARLSVGQGFSNIFAHVPLFITVFPNLFSTTPPLSNRPLFQPFIAIRNLRKRFDWHALLLFTNVGFLLCC